MQNVKLTLAELAIETSRHSSHLIHAELGRLLIGTSGPDGQLPAKRHVLADTFNLAVNNACQLPTADIADAIASLQMRFPTLWVETVRPGCRTRTGCLFQETLTGPSMIIVLENSVQEWATVWQVPRGAYRNGDRAIFSLPIQMRFGTDGIEWQGGDFNRDSKSKNALTNMASARLEQAIGKASQLAAKTHATHTQRDIEADIRKAYTAADFMARALVLMHCERLVDPAVYAETTAEITSRRHEGGALRRAVKAGSRIVAPCREIPYDIAAVARIATAKGARQVSALLKVVDIPVRESKFLQCRKTGAFLLDANGNKRRNKGYKRRQHVSEDYFDRQHMISASRPIETQIVDGRPIVIVKPR